MRPFIQRTDGAGGFTMNHPSSIDSEALTMANVIDQIYQQPLIGGDGQRKAKVQCLLIDIIANERRRAERAEVKASNWRQRYRELAGEE
jgi:hypothetical protein